MNEELYDKYKEEFEKDFTINAFNLEEVTMRLPARKHYWVARLHDLKRTRYRKEAEKRNLENEVIKQLQEKSPVKLDSRGATKQVKNSEQMKALSEELKNMDMIIAWLDDAVKIITFMTNDIKNIIEVRKLEEM